MLPAIFVGRLAGRKKTRQMYKNSEFSVVYSIFFQKGRYLFQEMHSLVEGTMGRDKMFHVCFYCRSHGTSLSFLPS